jgi:hypothetical protein
MTLQNKIKNNYKTKKKNQKKTKNEVTKKKKGEINTNIQVVSTNHPKT